VHPAFGRINDSLSEGAKSGAYSLCVANALWGQTGHPFLSSFIGLVRDTYEGVVNQLDFKKDPNGARKTINSWVEQQTACKIKDLIPSGMIEKLVRLVLTNAIYFKGSWVTEFPKQSTSDQPFHISASRQTQVRLMQQEATYKYFDGGSFQALEIPYAGNGLSMIVLLPRDKSGLEGFEKTISTETLAGWVNKMEPKKVWVYFPKFKVLQEFQLATELRALGMTVPFDRDKADFSLMNGMEPGSEEGLYISDVIHKAFIEVNEEGTEAAAATAVVMKDHGLSGAHPLESPIIFRADHPFVFFIRDSRSNSILFLGRVVNP
jgi:serpin B